MGGQPTPDSARPPPNVSVYRARPSARRMSAGIKRARTDWRRLRGVGAGSDSRIRAGSLAGRGEAGATQADKSSAQTVSRIS
jgi:hypothetical protein